MPSLRFSLTTALFCAASTLASSNPASGAIYLRADDVLSKPYSSVAGSSAVVIDRRQAPANPSAVLNGTTNDIHIIRNPDGTLNMDSWNTVTDAACIDALKKLPRSTNPSGHCVCYNLPSLDAQSGVFEADLRLYRISEPREGFATARPEDVQIEVKYGGAIVSTIDASAVQALGMQGQMASMTKRDFGDPELIRVSMLAGKINEDRLHTDMTMAQFEELVMPVLTLSAQNASGARVTTTVSLNEAVFLTGVFSNEIIVSDFGAAKASVDNSRAQLTSGQIAFVLPGTQIMIFPIGLIITSVWLLLGVSAYGYGTIQRMSYAESYKRRTNGSTKPRKTI
ncbi:hypothetical protein HJFPF1_02030 [Paramyrothecium foliicola]|nr:hypothetical protein HJFPF1_02030 [Paramyrothecium foliicola]